MAPQHMCMRRAGLERTWQQRPAPAPLTSPASSWLGSAPASASASAAGSTAAGSGRPLGEPGGELPAEASNICGGARARARVSQRGACDL
jgi:hypothetical protein